MNGFKWRGYRHFDESKKNGSPEEIHSMWICTLCEYPIGIIKKYNRFKGGFDYYIGVGKGESVHDDIEMIVETGQRYNNLGFLTSF